MVNQRMMWALALVLFASTASTAAAQGDKVAEDEAAPLAHAPPCTCGHCVYGGPGFGCEPGSPLSTWNVDTSLRRLGPCVGAGESSWVAGRLWFRAEYLAWDTKGYELPALVTTGSSLTAPTDVGQLDQADTSVLLGDSTVHDDVRSGGRFTVGCWCTPEQIAGVELGFLGVDGRDIGLDAHSDDFAVIAHPFTDAVSGNPDALLVAYPGLLEGGTSVRVDFEYTDAEALFRRVLHWTPSLRIDALAGYRYGRVRDSLRIHDSSLSLNAASGFAVDSIVERTDNFRVVNDFHGGELGLASRWWWNRWSIGALAKVAFGGVQTQYQIAGATSVSDLVGASYVTTDYNGGLLAAQTNNGVDTLHDTTAITEIGVTLECQIRSDTRLAIGYTFIGWGDVMRMAAVLPTEINATQIPPGGLVGAPLPAAPTLSQTSFWTQGINASFEYAF